ncbi:MAG: PIN domain-containing protein [Phycisphaerales bacterium]|nr:PIN domain-containing protein [Phycisphaerales bacterium]
MIALDTNVLVYARDPRDPRRQTIAAELIGSLRDCVLLWQVACEYVAVSRKLATFGFDTAQAMRDLRDYRAIWRSILPDWSVMDRAENLMARFSLSSWDALLIASCVENSVEELISEDFGGTETIDGVRIRNPFA